MLSYQHDYHAGNFADVHKHLVLWQVLEALRGREKPFVAVDLHAGAGGYDLTSARARKTDEATSGIARLWSADPVWPSAGRTFLQTLRGMQPKPPRLTEYPGSPLLIQARLRERDRLIACELHPEAYDRLQTRLAGDSRCHVHKRDAREAARALFPPEPRRGLVLLDPSYERKSEYREVAEMVATIRRRWNTGIILVWYPILAGRPDHPMREQLRAELDDPWLVSELRIAADPERHLGLAGSGMLVLRPPWQLEEQLPALLAPVWALLDPEGAGGLYQAAVLENGAGDPTLRRVENNQGTRTP
ncbi:protein involved in catabolism of external DNA [Thioalkalivibrio versutus]|uniref:Ribosomal RNA large subunit methyltransferase J n=1 Tax=Thioalkalivibrio versutus TaxID=106634 RepID=A0A0G3G415_9GAMM|nr:23S rRNA (adenine(2030)-N(6))-methyltransferase RlmJ [Thioalkalivibrio versutus]AKJ95985.1 protein involved in catabolism of external DNA [Thioalkalivibrio versutus]